VGLINNTYSKKKGYKGKGVMGNSMCGMMNLMEKVIFYGGGKIEEKKKKKKK